MRRFVSLAVLLFFTVPFGASIIGCGNKAVTQYCNGGDSGPVVGQAKSITLSPNFATFGESVDFGQMGAPLTASAVDCKGNDVTIAHYTFATSNMSFADINPSSGVVCGGTYNRNTGGGIPDYTTCTAPAGGIATITADSATSNVVTFTATNTLSVGQQVKFAGLTTAGFLNGQTLSVASTTSTSFTVNYTTANFPSTPDAGTVTTVSPPLTPLLAFVTATGDGAVSNAIPVYVHPTVTSIVIGSPTSSCSTDPDTSCCPVSTGAVITAPPYRAPACLSQGMTAQLIARAYKNGTTNAADNITCQVGHLQYSAQNLGVLNIDQNGVATATQPGSTIITASISTTGSGGAAGFFSTCPPASIQLSVVGQSNNATVNVNTSQPLSAIVRDTNQVILTGVPLEFNSTTPTTIPAGTGSVTPIFPGSATITAVCQPPACNSAPLSQAGLNGNGKPITSNGVQITAPGNNASVLYMGSTQSQYLLPYDFSINRPGSLLKLPYPPNSMVISNDGNTIYLGSDMGLMSITTSSNLVSDANILLPGIVLSVSPNSQTVVLTDPLRQTTSLVTGGTATTTTGGVGTRAQWSPDGHTVYVTGANNQLLVHSDYNGWYTTPTSNQYVDVAVTVPNVGAFFATNTSITEGRSYCPTTSLSSGNPPVATNTYYPVANDTAAQTDRIAATNDGFHILGATAATVPATLNDIALTIPNIQPTQANNPLDCTTATQSIVFNTVPAPHTLAGINATSITGVYPASNSALAFVTYNGTSGFLPEYVPATGQVSTVALSNGAIAPVAGVFSSDNKTFFAGTSGDDQVHLITVTGTSASDTSVIAPKLPDAGGNTTVPNLLVQRPKKATS